MSESSSSPSLSTTEDTEQVEKPESPAWKKIVHPSWWPILEEVSSDITRVGKFLRHEISCNRTYVPPGNKIFSAFQHPSDNVKVVLVGQDPYPTPGHAMGLSFSVENNVRPLPKSLINIFHEYHHDLGYPLPRNGDISAWSEQGVMLLNRVLTTQTGQPGAHQNQGWEKITEQAIAGLIQRKQPLVAILWGNQAKTLKPLLFKGGNHIRIVESVHPSPLSAHRGFFGSRPFSTTNALLQELGVAPVDWKLP